MKRGDWALLHREVIPAPDGSPYINRLRIVMTPWFSLYIHHIYKNDGDRHRHDHPWPFASWILRGGYVESIANLTASEPARTKARSRWSVHRHPRSICHRIEIVAPETVTMVLTGRRRKNKTGESDWGFYTESGYVPWQEYERA